MQACGLTRRLERTIQLLYQRSVQPLTAAQPNVRRRRKNRDECQPLDDFPTYFEYCHVSAVATANPWHDFDAGCVGKCCRYNRRLDDWNWPIWFHAAKSYGLGWADPGLSVDDDYCGIIGTWLGSSECEEMECGWSTGTRCPSNRGSPPGAATPESPRHPDNRRRAGRDRQGSQTTQGLEASSNPPVRCHICRLQPHRSTHFASEIPGPSHRSCRVQAG